MYLNYIYTFSAYGFLHCSTPEIKTGDYIRLFLNFISTWNLIVQILVSCISHVFRSKFSILKSISCASYTLLFHMCEIRFVYIFCILFCALQKHKKMFASAHTHTIIRFYSRLFQINMFIYLSTDYSNETDQCIRIKCCNVEVMVFFVIFYIVHIIIVILVFVAAIKC